jgi:hypothetical protein
MMLLAGFAPPLHAKGHKQPEGKANDANTNAVPLEEVVAQSGKPNSPPYDRNTDKAPKEEVITEGGIRMEIGKTIRLTPAPISAWHPFMKALRLTNGDLIFNCPLSGGTHRDYALSPKEEKALCALRSKDNGQTWQKTISQMTTDGGKTWTSEPTEIGHGPALLKDGSFISSHGQLSPDAGKVTKNKSADSFRFGYAPTMEQLRDGKILCAMQQGFLNQEVKGIKLEDGAYLDFALSEDGGAHWHKTGTFSFENYINDPSVEINSYLEPYLLRAANGDLLLFMRTKKHSSTGQKLGKYPPVKVVRSADEGITWSKPIEVHPTGVMPVATLLDNGIVVAFTGRGGNRVSASRDNGLSWHCRRNIMSTGQSPNFSGHNTILPLPNGRALLIYTQNHRHPDNKEGCVAGNRYAAELIGTFVTFKPVTKQE